MEKKNNDMLLHITKLCHISLTLLLNMAQEVYSSCHRAKKYMCKDCGNVDCTVSRQLRPDAQEFVVPGFDYNARHLIWLSITLYGILALLSHSCHQSGLKAANGMGMSSHYMRWTTVLPCPPFWNSGNLKSVTLAAPVLTWGSPALTRARAHLICKNLEQEESRRGWFDCGQLWKWLCAMKLWADRARFEPPPPTHCILYITQPGTFQHQV